jgi:hypothetical protein
MDAIDAIAKTIPTPKIALDSCGFNLGYNFSQAFKSDGKKNEYID